MSWLILVAGGLGVGAVACAFALWRYLSQLSAKAAEAELLRYENEKLKKQLADSKETAQAFTKPRRNLADLADQL